MSRVKRLVHSLLSGYIMLAVNTVFTLGSVRLALHYLANNEEFGLWATVSQLAFYMALMDFGLTTAAARILIDYKDQDKPGEYGGIIQTGALVGLVQGIAVFFVCSALAFVIAPLMRKIPAQLEPEFVWLLIAQCALTGLTFAIRIFAHILTAHQRFDVVNYGGALALIVNLAAMWWSFALGCGVFSLMYGQIAGVFAVLAVTVAGCLRLKLLPKPGQWGRPSWARFHELFSFGWDSFLVAVGTQIINGSQIVLLTSVVGLDAAAVWKVCTQAFLLLCLVIGRIFDFSSSALAEMMVRGERERLLRRFREIAVLTLNLSVAAGGLLAVCNGPFVEIWTKGRIHWEVRNDALLALWLVVSTAVRVHTGLVGQAKAFRFLRYLCFIEGFSFVSLAYFLHPYGGITMMLTASIVCALVFTCRYGLWRTCQYFNLSWRTLAGWHGDTLMLAISIAPVAALVWWFTLSLGALPRLAVASAILGTWTALMFLRFGLGGTLRAEAARRAPAWVRPILLRFGPAVAEA